MTRVILLKQLKAFTEVSTRDLLLPVRQQKEDTGPPADRAARVYTMRLVKSTAAQKAAPYIIHQVITGKDTQPQGQRAAAQAVIRSVFCIYNDEDEEAGALALLGLMERLRIDFLKQVVIGKQFQLDLEAGLESLIYSEDTAPYFIGEMVSIWHIPSAERETPNHFLRG